MGRSSPQFATLSAHLAPTRRHLCPALERGIAVKSRNRSAPARRGLPRSHLVPPKQARSTAGPRSDHRPAVRLRLVALWRYRLCKSRRSAVTLPARWSEGPTIRRMSARVPMPELSIVIPGCNRTHFLSCSVRSRLAQTASDFEVIVVDDGVTDGSREAASRFSGHRLQFALPRKTRVKSRRVEAFPRFAN